MLDISVVTTAVETILKDGLADITITRNEPRNDDPNAAAIGWIGIYRGNVRYERIMATGTAPWSATAEVIIEAQVGNMRSGINLESRLIALEQQVLTLLLQENPTLNGSVSFIKGYRVDYEEHSSSYMQASVITLECVIRV